ncbi:protein containing DUF1814 [Candidatus Omnitrophus magneticus]|uniref:Protein containing DUF1814 n=1 Tax=Candidatus Omnitrophus magneticus TaxID=1609969 RepID=A0A0F0CSE1_9BACT|nr:protein containing DUF1814 [Candidatus Omnitrophus magneticus]
MYAFKLLSELLKFYPDLVFKGGTSILLHIFPPARLSIDIDIILSERECSGLKDALIKMVSTSEWFDSVEEDIRTKNIPKAHYKFQFASKFSRISQYVLLDVVFAEHCYKKLVKKDIAKVPLIFFNQGNQIVDVPTQEGLFGDKMTAISSNTIGIPLNEKRSMEVVKQVIDLGELFNIVNDVDDIRQSFFNTVHQENKFRKKDYSISDILEDIVDIAFKYSQSQLKGADNSFYEIKLINDGLNRVVNHLRKKMSQMEIKIAFSKIVYMANILKGKDSGRLIKNVDLSLIQPPVFTNKYKILERLKAVNPIAYFYWAMSFSSK